MMKKQLMAALTILASAAAGSTVYALPDLSVETAWISVRDDAVENELITVRYDSVLLAEEISEDTVVIQESLDVMDREQIAQAQEYQSWYADLLSMHLQEGEDLDSFVPCSYYASANVKRFDESYTSILYKVDAYAGGAHPNCWYHGYNYETDTGDELEIGDVVTDTDLLIETVKGYLGLCYPQLDASPLDEMDIDELVWTMDADGITIYLGEYFVGSLYDGAQSIHIPYEEHESLFEEDVVSETVSWTTAVGNYEPVWLDADSDGAPEQLYAGMNTGEGRTMDANRYLYISYGDSFLEVDLPESTAMYQTLIRRYGTTYVYFQAEDGMDISWSALYELNGSQAVYCGDDLPSGTDPHVSHMLTQYPTDMYELIYGSSAEESSAESPEPEEYETYYTSERSPFYGIWVCASKNEEACQVLASNLLDVGFMGWVFVSSEWSNLNADTWYVVTAGVYSTYEEAYAVLESVHEAGYPDAYIRWSGEYLEQAY